MTDPSIDPNRDPNTDPNVDPASDPAADLYCLCSERSFDSILKLQRHAPLPFDRLIATYTGCRSGCGSCIDTLHRFLLAHGVLLSGDAGAEDGPRAQVERSAAPALDDPGAGAAILRAGARRGR